MLHGCGVSTHRHAACPALVCTTVVVCWRLTMSAVGYGPFYFVPGGPVPLTVDAVRAGMSHRRLWSGGR